LGSRGSIKEVNYCGNRPAPKVICSEITEKGGHILTMGDKS
jgi:hypothetical protein